jgi:hypothetical protein
MMTIAIATTLDVVTKVRLISSQCIYPKTFFGTKCLFGLAAFKDFSNKSLKTVFYECPMKQTHSIAFRGNGLSPSRLS